MRIPEQFTNVEVHPKGLKLPWLTVTGFVIRHGPGQARRKVYVALKWVEHPWVAYEVTGSKRRKDGTFTTKVRRCGTAPGLYRLIKSCGGEWSNDGR